MHQGFSLAARSILPLIGYPYEGAENGCPVCGGIESRPVARIDRRLKRLTTVSCSRCGLLRTSPMPTDAELGIYYSKLYRLDYQLAATKPSRRHIRKRSREADIRASRLLPFLSRGSRTLDFGAGSGEFVSAMLRAGMDAHGFDPGESYTRHARNGLGHRIETARWEDVAPNQDYDMVSCFHVLEHIRNPVDALKAAAGWLKKGGLLVVNVPDAPALLRAKGFGSLHFAHVVGFNRYNLEIAAGRAGFEAIKVLSPTNIVFRLTHRAIDMASLQAKAQQATASAMEDRSPARAYARHHLGKVGFQLG